MKNVHIHLELQHFKSGLSPDWKRAEGPEGCQEYCFRYVDPEGNPCEKTVLTAKDFHQQGNYKACPITMHLHPLHGLSAKFRWLNARSHYVDGGSTKGQRMSIMNWEEHQVTFAIDQKLTGIAIDENTIELDVWIGGLDKKLGEEELRINCDPKIEIQQ